MNRDPIPDAFYRDAAVTSRLRGMYLLRLRRLIEYLGHRIRAVLL